MLVAESVREAGGGVVGKDVRLAHSHPSCSTAPSTRCPCALAGATPESLVVLGHGWNQVACHSVVDALGQRSDLGDW
jgi:hypothetical protein